MSRVPRTNETLPNFREWCRATRHLLLFRGLTGCQRTPGMRDVTIAWGATIYHFWRQRNARVHDNHFITVDSIFSLICNDVRLRITSFQNVADNPVNRALCERWPFPLTILRSIGDA